MPEINLRYAACCAAVLERWCVVFSEAVAAVEGLHAGRMSPGFDVGIFTPVLDVPTHHFHAWLANRYADVAG